MERAVLIGVAVLGCGLLLLQAVIEAEEPSAGRSYAPECSSACAPFRPAPENGRCYCDVSRVDPTWEPPSQPSRQSW